MIRDRRRLAAIVSADVAGYSRLMGRDESGTLASLKALVRELIDPKIAEYDGRIVKSMGDGLLLEFPSVVDAVRCAIDVQRGMAERNVGVPLERQLQFRIGINVGDIITEGADIFGDGVNVAARLQALAEPGGICVSRVVRDQVLDKLSFAFEELGPQQLKNIARPVEAYRVALRNEPLPISAHGRQRSGTTTWRWIGAGTVLLLVTGGATGWYVLTQGDSRTAAASVPPSFSIAVLPFVTPGGTAADEAVASDATLVLTEAIGKQLPYAWVISPGLAATYRGKAIDPRAVGRELNVRYVVEGGVRHAGDRVSLSANLIDAGTATQVWTDRAETADAKTGTSAVTVPPQLVSGLLQALSNAEIRRVAKQGPAAASAMDLVIQGWAIERDVSLDALLKARKLYGEALRIDPNLLMALVSRAGASIDVARLDPRADRDALLREANQLTNRAMALDASDPRVWVARGWVLAHQRRLEESLAAYEQSLRIAPHRAKTLNDMSIVMIWSGRAEESLPWIDKALEYEGRADPILYQRKCSAHTLLGRYQDAVAACEKSAALGADASTYVYLTAVYAQLGERARAASAKEQLLRGWPDFTLARWKLFITSDNKVYWEQVEKHLFAGLRKAGIREG